MGSKLATTTGGRQDLHAGWGLPVQKAWASGCCRGVFTQDQEGPAVVRLVWGAEAGIVHHGHVWRGSGLRPGPLLVPAKMHTLLDIYHNKEDPAYVYTEADILLANDPDAYELAWTHLHEGHAAWERVRQIEASWPL